MIISHWSLFVKWFTVGIIFSIFGNRYIFVVNEKVDFWEQDIEDIDTAQLLKQQIKEALGKDVQIKNGSCWSCYADYALFVKFDDLKSGKGCNYSDWYRIDSHKIAEGRIVQNTLSNVFAHIPQMNQLVQPYSIIDDKCQTIHIMNNGRNIQMDSWYITPENLRLDPWFNLHPSEFECSYVVKKEYENAFGWLGSTKYKKDVKICSIDASYIYETTYLGWAINWTEKMNCYFSRLHLLNGWFIGICAYCFLSKSKDKEYWMIKLRTSLFSQLCLVPVLIYSFTDPLTSLYALRANGPVIWAAAINKIQMIISGYVRLHKDISLDSKKLFAIRSAYFALGCNAYCVPAGCVYLFSSEIIWAYCGFSTFTHTLVVIFYSLYDDISWATSSFEDCAEITRKLVFDRFLCFPFFMTLSTLFIATWMPAMPYIICFILRALITIKFFYAFKHLREETHKV